MEDDKKEKGGDEFAGEVEKFIAKLELSRAPDIGSNDLLEEMHLQAQKAFHDCEVMRLSIDRRIRNLDLPHPEGDDPTDLVVEKGQEYLAISTCIHFARQRMAKGEPDEALQLAALAGRSYPGMSSNNAELLKKVIANMSRGRKKALQKRQKDAEIYMDASKRMIDDLFRIRDGKVGKGWRMSKKQIYAYLSENNVDWSPKYAEQKIGSYIDEVKAKNRT